MHPQKAIYTVADTPANRNLPRNSPADIYSAHKKSHSGLNFIETIVSTITRLAESRDSTIGRHLGRTARTLDALMKGMLERGLYAKELGMLDLDVIVVSSQLHDIGKMAIHDDILLKRGKLTNDEYELMKKHVDQGVKIVDRLNAGLNDNNFLYYARAMIATHHEKWDGSGYPNKLAGAEIPIFGRLMAIADVYDALISERPYKKAYSYEEALQIIKNSSGTHFDPVITAAFPEIIKK